MGDRNNPIKFGPEWLRNLSREPSAGSSASNSQNSGAPGSSSNTGGPGGGSTGLGAMGSTGPGSLASGGPGGGSGATGNSNPSTSSGSNTRNANNMVPKVQLAKLRYGREEMLALYHASAEAPEELKYFDLLYQPRGKPPVALNNTFEEEVRDNIRGGPPIGAAAGERFSLGRGMGRGTVGEARGRPRMPFVRQTSGGRSTTWHGNTRMPLYTPGDEEASALRSWGTSNGGNTNNRTTNEQAEWTPNKMYRSRRQANNTNWRQQQNRDEGDEWRSPETARNNRPQMDKWDRDWGERPAQERPQSWNANRRTWVGGESHGNEENLPEWAVGSAEAVAGTFDSSGAFHGYSNDDTNLPPRTQESSYPLARSHTHASFGRSKTVEEGSEEWWASEKAKKLSPKRFDANDIKFKKSGSGGLNDPNTGPGGNNKQNSGKEEPDDDSQDKIDKQSDNEQQMQQASSNASDESNSSKNNVYHSTFSESKTFDAMMRSDIDMGNTGDERGNFQSVMITPGNSLRQKHQNIVSAVNEAATRQSRNSGILQMLQHSIPINHNDNESHQSPEDKIVDEIFDMTLDDAKLAPPNLTSLNQSNSSALSGQMPNPGMPLGLASPALPSHGLAMKTPPSMTAPGIQGPGIQNIGIQNSALNSSLGLSLGPSNNAMMIPMAGAPPPAMPNSQMNPALGAASLQARGVVMPGFQPSGLPVMPSGNVANSSLFLGQNNAPQMSSNDIPLPGHGPQGNMFPMHGLQHSNSQPAFGSIYSNMMPPAPTPTTPGAQNLVDQWYYEDPKKIIQGPFTSKEMYNWYRAGFFSPSLMVRRACDAHMRPLGSYGPVVPFAQMDMMSPFPMAGNFESRPQGGHEILNQQQGLGLEDSLWRQPTPSPDLMWMHQAMSARNESRVNNLPMFFWDPQPSSGMSSNSLLTEDITKEMKTEDQILAQMRASQNIPTPQKMNFLNESSINATNTPLTLNKPEDTYTPNISSNISNISSNINSNMSATPNLDELQKLIDNETKATLPAMLQQQKTEKVEAETKLEKISKIEPPTNVESTVKPQPPPQPKPEPKPAKTSKSETEVSKTKTKETTTKTKNKKAKEEKKEESSDTKIKEEEVAKVEQKRSVESSPSKNKKEEKQSKKDLEKEKKELTKDGFTIVKGSEKSSSKDNKKKAEETRAAEEAERKRKDEEKMMAAEEEKRKKAEITKKNQEQQQRQAVESIIKKAPWSVGTQSVAPNKDGMTLAEIQRLEKEKKVEQMKEQQQMMQIIAQHQAAIIAREQVIQKEMQSGLGWAKKKGNNMTMNMPGQSLAEIQAEARRQSASAAAAAAAAQALEEAQALQAAPSLPWTTSTQNGGSVTGIGFWDPQPSASPKASEKSQESKPAESKPKKKVTLSLAAKKETSPSAEFETWCTGVLTSWSSKIDVPTFIGFLKDIESPYEVKDYVKCYLGETKDASDFARQFLERRSKLLRVGMVTPSDDLCSPAMAINPRTPSASDYQDVKGKGKKTKKNKMLKVDARILGFSVTASEDRINVGDIDTA